MIKAINHITLAVVNIDTSFRFYKDVLGFKPLCKWNNGAYFLCGETWFCLNHSDVVTPRDDYTHIAFDIKAPDFIKMKQKLLDAKVVVFKENQSEGNSLYFLDPDGYKLELHVGNWQSRIASKHKNLGSWQDVEFFV